jgi:microfibrillar-associated protein 1
MPDDADRSEDEASAHAEWRLRELRRLKRDAEEEEAAELARRETARRRGLTDAQIEAEDRTAAGAGAGEGAVSERSRAKWTYLQRYYHRGAFYMDEGSLTDANDPRLRNYHELAAPGDAVQREALPRVMQVRDWGMRGRTKWTHLLAEDTSAQEPRHPWARRDDGGLRAALASRGAGLRGSVRDAGRAHKRPREADEGDRGE